MLLDGRFATDGRSWLTDVSNSEEEEDASVEVEVDFPSVEAEQEVAGAEVIKIKNLKDKKERDLRENKETRKLL